MGSIVPVAHAFRDGDRVRLNIPDDDMDGRTGVFRGYFTQQPTGEVKSYIELEGSRLLFPADPATVKPSKPK